MELLAPNPATRASVSPPDACSDIFTSPRYAQPWQAPDPETVVYLLKHKKKEIKSNSLPSCLTARRERLRAASQDGQRICHLRTGKWMKLAPFLPFYVPTTAGTTLSVALRHRSTSAL